MVGRNRIPCHTAWLLQVTKSFSLLYEFPSYLSPQESKKMIKNNITNAFLYGFPKINLVSSGSACADGVLVGLSLGFRI